MSGYLPRLVDAELSALLRDLPAVAVNGPKAVGKTASAQRIARTTFRLDEPAVAEVVNADPTRVRSATPPVLLDEWQRQPTLWDAVRRWVDDGADPGTFVLTGSAAPRDAAVHSGAGRIVQIRMRPLSLAERALHSPTVSLAALLTGTPPIAGECALRLADYVHEITSSGFPGIRTLPPNARRRQLDGYLDNIIEREFADQGLLIRAPDTLRRWLRAYAAATGTTASYTAILDGATAGESYKPAKTTTIAYRDVLHSLWLLDPVEAWNPGGATLGRLGHAPKHFLADPALAARLLLLDDDDLLTGAAEADPVSRAVAHGRGTVLGRLFESLVALGLHSYAAHAEASLRHLRTRNGDHEVDFVVQRGQRIVAIETKLAETVSDADVRHLNWLRQHMGPTHIECVVVTTGRSAYRRRDGVAVVPAGLLGP